MKYTLLTILLIGTLTGSAAAAGAPSSTASDTACRILDSRLDTYVHKVEKTRTSVEEKVVKEIAKLKKDHLEKKEATLEKVDTRTLFGGKQLRALEARATSTESQQAIADFKTAVTSAANARAAALEVAFNEFHASALAAISDYETKLKEAMSTRLNAITAASAKAKADCLSGSTPDLIRLRWSTLLNNAEDTFKLRQVQMENLKAMQRSLIEVRKAKYAKAVSDFHLAVEAATTKLKAALIH